MSNSTISDQSLMDKSMRSVFVGNIPYEATEENLKDIFSEVGPVLSFKLVYDRETGKPKGYGFCEYKDQETALSAMRNLNGYEIGGRTLRVDNACTEKSRMEMQSLLQGQNTENPYGEAVQADKAPEAISKAVASLPPEQMFELMKQMKLCVQNNPNEARQMLLQNPQLAYALLQAQVVMRIVDPHTAVSMLHKANPIPNVLTPAEKSPIVHPHVPPRIEEPWAAPPRPAVAAINPPAPMFTGGQDVDLRIDRQIDPRLARMDQDLRGLPPPTQPPPMSVNAPVIDSRGTNFIMPDKDPRTDRFGRDPRDPRDPRMPVDPRINKNANPAAPTIVPPPPSVTRPVLPSTNVPPPIVPNNATITNANSVSNASNTSVNSISNTTNNTSSINSANNTLTSAAVTSGLSAASANVAATASTTSRLMAGMSPAGNIPSGASDQEKAALIMQVLQLSDEQIAMLPPEQKQSILVLKEQIAKSTQR